MHLVRIKYKPHIQHGPVPLFDPTDPRAVAIRRPHPSPSPSPQQPRFKRPIWQALPFVNKVSNLY